MAHAISQTFSSVIGSSVTTIAGFIALCFMSFTLGMDIGIVMVKGVVLGVVACVTILPAMILADSAIDGADAGRMLSEMEKVDGIKWALGLDSVIGPTIPKSMIPNSVTSALKNDKYQLILANSEYKVATDELNDQIKELNTILHNYDENGMLIGEGPLTADLIDITDTDFKHVSAVSIGIIFVIIMLLFKSVSLPFILVGVIEFAIFVNMGIPYYT